MEETFINSLDAESARLVRAALAEAELGDVPPDLVSQAEQRAVEVAREIKSNSSFEDARSFAHELTGFLDRARERALEAKRLQDEISFKQGQVSQAQAEIKRLSAGRPALAEAVNEAALRYEEARSDYGQNEFAIATTEELVVQRRSEILTLRRQLA